MFFSRIAIDRRSLDPKEFYNFFSGNAYASHQLLWKFFDKEFGAKRDFLFRQELNQYGIKFFVVSVDRPKTISTSWKVETKDYQPQIKQGEILEFSLRANPVVALRQEGKKNSVHHDVLVHAKTEAKAEKLESGEINKRIETASLEWLKNRAERLGFQLLEGDASPKPFLMEGYFQHSFFKKNQSKPIKFSSLDYEGALQVTDPELFKKTLFEGVGRSKSFGCGLMMVRKI